MSRTGNKVGKVTKEQVREIAQIKLKDLNAVDLEGAIRTVEGPARSIGIEVVRAEQWQIEEKNIQEARDKVDRSKRYELEGGVKALLKTAYAKFDEGVDLAIRLGVDPKKGGPDGPWHGCPSQRNREEGEGLGLCQRPERKGSTRCRGETPVAEDLMEKISQGWLILTRPLLPRI